jgi:hypothetical protein
MTEAVSESNAGQSGEGKAEDINTPGAGNSDLTGQAKEIVESAEEGVTGPTPGGG